MSKTKRNAIIVGRLIFAYLLILIKWLMQPLFALFLALYSFFEAIITGCNVLIVEIQKANENLLKDIK